MTAEEFRAYVLATRAEKTARWATLAAPFRCTALSDDGLATFRCVGCGREFKADLSYQPRDLGVGIFESGYLIDGCDLAEELGGYRCNKCGELIPAHAVAQAAIDYNRADNDFGESDSIKT